MPALPALSWWLVPVLAVAAVGADDDAGPVLRDFAFIGCSSDEDTVPIRPEAWRAIRDEKVSFLVHHSASCGLAGDAPQTHYRDGVLDLAYDMAPSSGSVVMCECEYWATFTFGSDAAAIGKVTFRGEAVQQRGEWPVPAPAR